MIVAAIGLVLRFRRARGVERQQLRWFALAATLSAIAIVMDMVLGEAYGNSDFANAFVPLTMAFIPARAVRDRPHPQPDAFIRAGDRRRGRDLCAGRHVRLAAGAGVQHSGGCGCDARRRSDIQTGAPPGAGRGGSPIQPGAVRRRAGGGRLRGTTAGRGGCGCEGGGPAGDVARTLAPSSIAVWTRGGAMTGPGSRPGADYRAKSATCGRNPHLSQLPQGTTQQMILTSSS